MKINSKQQVYLKGFLLLILAANVASLPTLEKIQSLDLARVSETVGSGQRVRIPSPRPYMPTSRSKDGITPSNKGIQATQGLAPQSAPAPAARPDDEEPMQEEIVEAPSEMIKACGIGFHVKFHDALHLNEPITIIKMRPFESGQRIAEAELRFRDSVMTNLEDQSRKEHIDKRIQEALKSHVIASNKPCGNVAVNNQGIVAAPAEEPKKEKETKETRRSCRRDEAGNSLEKSDRIRCRLEVVLEGEDKDETDRIKRSRALRDLEALVKGDAKRELRDLLSSEDESEVEEGEELLEDVVDGIKDIADEYDLDESRTRRLIGQLEAMKAGGDMYRRSSEKSEAVTQLGEDIQRNHLEMKLALEQVRQNPLDTMAQADMLTLQEQNRVLLQKHGIITNDVEAEMRSRSYAELLAFRRQGLVDSGDFSYFMSPYESMRRNLVMVLDTSNLNSPSLVSIPGSIAALPGTETASSIFTLPTLGSALAGPGDVSEVRARLFANSPRSHGVSLPPRPSLNMGNFGFNTPGFTTQSLAAPNSAFSGAALSFGSQPVMPGVPLFDSRHVNPSLPPNSPGRRNAPGLGL